MNNKGPYLVNYLERSLCPSLLSRCSCPLKDAPMRKLLHRATCVLSPLSIGEKLQNHKRIFHQRTENCHYLLSLMLFLHDFFLWSNVKSDGKCTFLCTKNIQWAIKLQKGQKSIIREVHIACVIQPKCSQVILDKSKCKTL